MFPMKNVTTKTDHLAAIEAAISDAEAHGVSVRAICSRLRSSAQLLENRAYSGPYQPKMYGQDGKLINYAKQVSDARAARQAAKDAACVIPPSERQVAASGYRK